MTRKNLRKRVFSIAVKIWYSDLMQTIKIFNEENVSQAEMDTFSKRISVRAIVMDTKDKVALIYSEKLVNGFRSRTPKVSFMETLRRRKRINILQGEPSRRLNFLIKHFPRVVDELISIFGMSRILLIPKFGNKRHWTASVFRRTCLRW